MYQRRRHRLPDTDIGEALIFLSFRPDSAAPPAAAQSILAIVQHFYQFQSRYAI